MFGTTLAQRVALVVLLATPAVAGTTPRGARAGEPERAALAPAQVADATFTYQGYVTDARGEPLSGSHGFMFRLWDAQNGGNTVGGNVETGPLPVRNGVFDAELEVPGDTFDGRSLWLQVGVDGEWLEPRQALRAAPMAYALRPGALVQGEVPFGAVLNLANLSTGQSGSALFAAAGGDPISVPNGRHGVIGVGAASGVAGFGSGTGVLGTGTGDTSAGGTFNGYTGVVANGSGGAGVDATSDETFAVHASSVASWAIVGVSGRGVGPEVVVGYRGVSGFGVNHGVYGDGNEAGVVGVSGPGAGVLARSAGQARYNAALRAENTNPSQGMAAYFVNASDYATVHARNQGSGEVLLLESAGGRFLDAVGPGWDTKFRLEANGQAFADGSWNAGGADVAEMLPAEPGLLPGEVLVIGADGRLARSSSANQSTVAGVLSESPGFVAGRGPEGAAVDAVALAVVGVVPVWACAANGPIAPGDLLVTSPVPGRAMRAGADPAIGTVIGKALEPLPAGTGRIRMLATLQ